MLFLDHEIISGNVDRFFDLNLVVNIFLQPFLQTLSDMLVQSERFITLCILFHIMQVAF